MLIASESASTEVIEPLPAELCTLRDRVRGLPERYRAAIGPAVDEVLEEARFRGRIIVVAREALERLHLDLELARFDLEVTRREREQLRRAIEGP